MEVTTTATSSSSSSFHFQNQEDYLTHFYASFFQEMDGGSSNKRPREEFGNGVAEEDVEEVEELRRSNGFREIFNSFANNSDPQQSIAAEGIDEVKEERWISQDDGMGNYFMNLQESDSYLLDEPEQKTQRNKRAKTASFLDQAGSDSDHNSAENSTGPSATVQHRRLWVKDRSKAWWEWCNHPDFPPEEFKKAFRMSRATFDMICHELDSAVNKKDTMLRAAIPVRQRVAVCIYRLATGEPLRLVSKKFGLGISTCHKLVLEVCSAIKTVLMPKFLQWPDEAKMNKIQEEFESISGISNVGGSIYTTHIPIIAPKMSVAAYFNKRHTERNQKTSYSITVQGVVDSKGVFSDVCIGYPGSWTDDQVLEKSALFQRGNRGHLKDVWIVGNSGFPLLDWLLAPYTHPNLTWAQHGFNEKVGDIHKVAKDAFGRMKGRWSCLQKRTEVKLQDLPVVLGACCVLHNICEVMGETMDPESTYEAFDDEMVPENSMRSTNSAQAREHIAHNLLHHGLAGTSFL